MIAQQQEYKKAYEYIRAIRNDKRDQLIKYLREHPGTTVSSLYKRFKMEQSECSAHLKILRDANVVTGTRDGKNVHYTVNEEVLEANGNTLKELR